LDRKSWRPVVRKDGKTDVTIAIYMRVLGYVVADERDRWRVKWVALVEFKLKLECLAFIQAALSGINLHNPPRKRAKSQLRRKLMKNSSLPTR
jgi:hypothetical protein